MSIIEMELRDKAVAKLEAEAIKQKEQKAASAKMKKDKEYQFYISLKEKYEK